jgi:dipeptidyl aminopeptidase/acylaminoacyl peptidase
MYLDSQHIIFSGDAPYIVDGDRSMAESFAKRGGENTVYRYKIGATSPELLFKELKSSVGPMASDDRKKIVYVSRSEKLSKDKKYQFDVILFSDGKHVPLTDPGPPITALVISADGKHAAITRMNSDSSPLVTVIDIEDKNKTSKVRLKPVFDNCDFFTEELKHGS